MSQDVDARTVAEGTLQLFSPRLLPTLDERLEAIESVPHPRQPPPPEEEQDEDDAQSFREEQRITSFTHGELNLTLNLELALRSESEEAFRETEQFTLSYHPGSDYDPWDVPDAVRLVEHVAEQLTEWDTPEATIDDVQTQLRSVQLDGWMVAS